MRIYMPVLLEQALATMVTMLGTMMMSAVGEYAVSGIGLVDSINFVFMNMLTAVATGVTAVVAQYLGRSDPRAAGRATMQAILLALYIGVLFGAGLLVANRPMLQLLFGEAQPDVLQAASNYMVFSAASMPLMALFAVVQGVMRASGDTRTPLFGSFVANIVYLGVCIGCIKGFGLGVESAGIGLTASRTVSASLMLFFMQKNRRLPTDRFTLRLNKAVLRPVLDIAVPNGLDSLVFNGCKVIVQVFMSGMGTSALAANAIAMSLLNFLQLPGRTYQITVVIDAGHAYGGGRIRRARLHTLGQALHAMLSQVGMSLAMAAVLTPVLTLFTRDPQTTLLARQVTLLMLVATPLFWPASFVIPNALRAMGDARFTMVVSMISMVVLRLFGSWLLGVYLGWGILGVNIAMALDWFGRGIPYAWRAIAGPTRRMADTPSPPDEQEPMHLSGPPAPPLPAQQDESFVQGR